MLLKLTLGVDWLVSNSQVVQVLRSVSWIWLQPLWLEKVTTFANEEIKY